MKRHAKGSAFDISIRGDELEHHRIQLEHNLQNTELSFRLSSTSDDEHGDPYPRHQKQHNSSIEYPRHISEPSLIADFPSFAHRSRELFGDEDHGAMHAWSYRTGDDEEGIHPYAGETISTTGHHASALTLNAGLGGGRGARRDPSLSGAEYDPDRPLQAMMAGVNSKHSMLNDNPSKHQAMESMTYDPLVVDSTAELDRILQSGHAPPPVSTSHSFHPTPPTSSVSSDSDQPPRPRLADHLRHVSFSPKRPRTAQANLPNPISPIAKRTAPTRITSMNKSTEARNTSVNMPTPRPARRNLVSSSPALQPQSQPELKLQPATPSSAGSRFTRMARGINKELEATQEELNARQKQQQRQQQQQQQALQNHAPRPSSAPIERNPFHDPVNQPVHPSARPRRGVLRDTSGRIQLPDVTGLTIAVESPAKPGVGYYAYKGDDKPGDMEVRLLQTLRTVTDQLRDLEEENGISRRRVRELEMELEECKREVARERTRLFEREELTARQYGSGSGGLNTSFRFGGGKNNKGKGRADLGPPEIDDERLHARYKEAVDEKKALEALINSLRSHLTRLTSELASHQELLTELRKLRDSDSQSLREKGAEIIQLKEEVQRLAGEVEVLRGVVEEGLKERRASREIQDLHVESEEADLGMSQDLEESEDDDEYIPESDAEETEEEEAEPFDPMSMSAESPTNAIRGRAADRTMQTDHATLGSTNLGDSTNTDAPGRAQRFVDDDELDDIAAELEERRSNRSNASITVHLQPRSPSPVRTGNVRQRQQQRQQPTVEDVEDEEDRRRPQQHLKPPVVHSQPPPPPPWPRAGSADRQSPKPSTSRPAAPTPVHAAKQYGRLRARPQPQPQRRDSDSDTESHRPREPETPFPQIRGEQLERLFFSAPEHNAATCTVCYRRRYRSGAEKSPSWSHPRRAAAAAAKGRQEEEKDEGYEEGEEGAEAVHGHGNLNSNKGKQREQVDVGVGFSADAAHWRRAGRSQGVPPQTVVARVIRELEDDFTHYKSIYVELADQYKVMDAVSDVPRRNMLAQHLREVVDILEQKGNQIAALYDLLEFKDKPVSESIVPDKNNDHKGPRPALSCGPAYKHTGLS